AEIETAIGTWVAIGRRRLERQQHRRRVADGDAWQVRAEYCSLQQPGDRARFRGRLEGQNADDKRDERESANALNHGNSSVDSGGHPARATPSASQRISGVISSAGLPGELHQGDRRQKSGSAWIR